ncbi:hypothetical protein FRC07_009501, partial [Ceratobasidium sp. 392]
FCPGGHQRLDQINHIRGFMNAGRCGSPPAPGLLFSTRSFHNLPVATSSEASPANEGFRTGGDITLRSLDGVEFNVHSVVLSLASPVLGHMLEPNQPQPVIHFAETSNMLSFMLKFIYPRPPPSIPSLKVLGQGLYIAQKYHLEGMECRLRKELSVRDSPLSIYSDPVGALAIATVYNLADEATLAASLVDKSYNLQKADSLVKLAETTPSIARLVKAIGLPSARTSILIEVLFYFHQKPMLLTQHEAYMFLCTKCDKIYHNKARYGAPEWQARWAHWAFQELRTRNISEAGEIFKVEFFKIAMDKGVVPLQDDICGCHTRIYDCKREFEAWTATIREALVDRLKPLEALKSLD